MKCRFNVAVLRLCPSVDAKKEVILEIIVHDATVHLLCPCGHERWAEEIEVIGHDEADVLECNITSGHAPTGPAAEALKFKMVILSVSEFHGLRDEGLAILLY